MRNAALMLILLCLAGCAFGAPSGTDDGWGGGLWPDHQVARDVAAISLGMAQARGEASAMAAGPVP
jgi:hypothetical protein